jgi:putative ABC transport system permease protein
VLLKPGTNVNALQAKMTAFAQRYMGDDMKTNGYTVSFELQPLKDIHTRSDYDYEMSAAGICITLNTWVLPPYLYCLSP